MCVCFIYSSCYVSYVQTGVAYYIYNFCCLSYVQAGVVCIKFCVSDKKRVFCFITTAAVVSFMYSCYCVSSANCVFYVQLLLCVLCKAVVECPMYTGCSMS